MKSKSFPKDSVSRTVETENASDPSNERNEKGKIAETAEFDEFGSLRLLLLSQEQDKITQLEAKVANLQSQLDSIPPASSEEVSDVLPKAIKQRTKLDNQLSKATLPIVVENIRQSVKENPQVLAEALFPAIGPSIRKAIADALGTMVQSLNQTIEYSFSPRSVKWRLEALQTGKSFGEVVLLKTLLYRVEEIFLIHKETGLLVQHVSANIGKGQDADMVSAMLTAIQDFVRDSFSNSADANLDTLKLGDLSVWIERSKDLLFAAVIRGNAPLDLRERFKTSVEEIEIDHEDELLTFKGNADDFERSRPILQDCLTYQLGSQSKKSGGFFKPLNIGLAALSLILCIAGFFFIRDYWRWSSYVSRLKTETGIVVTDAERGWFQHSIQGLRDPFAVDPDKLLIDFGLDTTKVQTHWEEYQSSNSDIVLKRAKAILNPPATASLSFANGILSIDGKAPAAWAADAKKLAAGISGVKEVKVNTDSIAELAAKIESQKISFVCNTLDFEKEQNASVSNLASQLFELHTIAKGQNRNFHVEIRGTADGKGSAESNAKISIQRAEKLKSALIANSADLKNVGIQAVNLTANEGIGCTAQIKVILD